MGSDEIRKVKTWDELPPVVQANGETFSTRILEQKYREMESELEQTRERSGGVIDRKYIILAINPCNGHIHTEKDSILFSVEDLAVPGMLARYYDECVRLGCDSNHLKSVGLLIGRVEERQKFGARIPDTDMPCEIDRCIGGKL